MKERDDKFPEALKEMHNQNLAVMKKLMDKLWRIHFDGAYFDLEMNM